VESRRWRTFAFSAAVETDFKVKKALKIITAMLAASYDSKSKSISWAFSPPPSTLLITLAFIFTHISSFFLFFFHPTII
jgi:hypothetical protein